MPSTEIAGLGEIQAWAQFLGINVQPTLEKVWQLTQPNPTAMWDGSDKLGGVAGGLETERGDLNQAGADVLASGMVGLTADAIGQVGPELAGQVGDAAGAARQLAGKIGEVATAFAESQAAVIALTGATGTALGMLRT